MLRFSIVLLLAACASAAPAPELSGPGIERPDVKVGERWTYRRLDGYSLAELSKAEVRVVKVDADGIHSPDARWTRDWNAVGAHDDEVITPHDASFRFPLRSGATYPVAYDVRWERFGARLYFNGRATVLGWEDVTVPAGSFHALKIQIDVKAPRNLHPVYTVDARKTLWYSPAVKRWVRLDYSERVGGTPVDTRWISELVDYKLN